jgi:phosphatidylinositol alpha-1,6-mannosyltransferase
MLLTEVFPPRHGGSGRWLWELYRRLPLDVTVVTADHPDAAAFDASCGLAIERAPLTFPSWGLFDLSGAAAYIKAFRRVARTVRRLHPTAIHSGKARPEGLLALLLGLRFGLPYVCFVHGEELRLAHTSRDLAWLTRRVLAGAGTIVANSEHTHTILRDEWHVRDRVVVMHPGVDTSRFVPAPADAAVREQLGWTGRRVVLTVGSLQERKGQDMMIRALPAIRAACPDVLYVAAGGGAERTALQELAGRLDVQDAVQFPGAPSEDTLVSYYQQCDLFALPNRQVGWDIEGFGIVLLEAQACGVPVIAGCSGGTRETMRPGITGELVPCESPEPLADAVVALLQAPERRRAMGAAGREWTTSHFSWQVLAQQAQAIFAKTSA